MRSASRLLIGWVVAVMGCIGSSHATDAGAGGETSDNCDITGDYVVTSTMTSNTCPASVLGTHSGTVALIAQQPGYTVAYVLDNIAGNCSGGVSGANCNTMGSCTFPAGDSGTLTDTINWNFTVMGFTGTDTVTGTINGTPCMATYAITGTGPGPM